MKKYLLLLALLVGAYFFWQSARPPNAPFGAPPGAYLATEPAQSFSLRVPFRHLGYTIFTLAAYELDARILGSHPYSDDESGDLVPVDLALGWGAMADLTNLSQISVSQSDRKFYWHAAKPPIPTVEISRHSANTHIIPATPEVKNAIAAFRVGELVSLRGRLVSVSGPGGWSWSSSLTRDDTGEGACELFYVESAQKITASSPAKATPPSSSALPSRSAAASASPPPLVPTPATVPVAQASTAASVRILTLKAATQIPLKYGTLTIPAGDSINILEERSGRFHATYRAHDFWIEKNALPW